MDEEKQKQIVNYSEENKQDNLENDSDKAITEDSVVEIENKDVNLLEKTNLTENENSSNHNIKEEEKNVKGLVKYHQKVKNILILLCFIFVVILAIVYFVFNNSKNLFLAAINKEYGNMLSHVQTIGSSSKYELAKNSTLTTKGNFSLKISSKEEGIVPSIDAILKEINAFSAHYEIGKDYKNKKIATQFLLNYNQKNMFDIGIYGEKKSLYIELKNMLDKYISVPIDDFDQLFNDPTITNDDLKYMIKTIKDALLDSLDSKDFKSESKTIEIEGKKIKTKKISYTLSERNIHKLYESVIKKLKENDTFIEMISKYTGKKKSKITTSMQENLIKSKDKTLLKKQVTMSVYVKGMLNDVIKFQIGVDKDSDLITYTKQNKGILLSLKQYGKELLTITSEKESQNYTYKIKSGQILLTIKEKKEKDKKVYNYTLETGTKMDIVGSMTLAESQKNKTYDGSLKLIVKIRMNKADLYILECNNDYITTVGEKIILPDMNGKKVSIEAITKEEQDKILSSLFKNEVFMEFYNKLQTYN